METEFEAQFLDIKVEEIRKKLIKQNAKLVCPERLMRRKVYNPQVKEHDWFRVRDEGDKVTLSYKKLESRAVDGVREINVKVDDFENTCLLLEKTGVIYVSYQETKRETWSLDSVAVEIDTWPWIPSFVEIEGKSELEVKNISEQLGFVWSEASFGSVENVYQKHYDVTEQEVDEWEEITLTPVPEWLEAKRRFFK